MSGRWYEPSIRWPEFSLPRRPVSFSWPDFSFSNLGVEWINFSIVDDLLWTFIVLLESLVLITMLSCFYLCCGFTL